MRNHCRNRICKCVWLLKHRMLSMSFTKSNYSTNSNFNISRNYPCFFCKVILATREKKGKLVFYLARGPLRLAPAPLPVAELGFAALLLRQPPLGSLGRRGAVSPRGPPRAVRRGCGATCHRPGPASAVLAAQGVAGRGFAVPVAVVPTGDPVDAVTLLEGQAESEPPTFG